MSLSPFDNKIYMTNHGAKGGDWFGSVNFAENYGWKILGWGGTNYTGTKIGRNGNQVLQKQYQVLGSIDSS